ncbi:P2X purinoceptor 6-like isoform X2 [Ascaphus truei]|uniref:P2X purinoceptor 6-like isoform X2 n=1 Tax=Ascaphus truei TaxID=8439 RepID=UPI003F5A413E
MEASGCRKYCLSLLHYKTEKYVLTKNTKIGVLHRLLHLGILCYVIGWVFITKKGYQETDFDPHTSVITKLKGVSVTKNFRNLQDRLWDVADFVKPSQGENVLFLVTNFIATSGQVQGTCPEDPLIVDGRCGEDLDCTVSEPVVNGNGIKTGKCVRFNNTHSTCEIYGWCPVENGSLPRANTLETSEETYFKSCMYDPASNPYCPVFRIQDMLTEAGHSFEELATEGGAVAAHIEWTCDLDLPASACKPHYSFRLQDKNYNFRTATYYWDLERREYRDLLKLYGIRFDISVTGEARRFSIVPTVVSLGTGCAFLGAATFLCDLILLYVDGKASLYRSWKYEEVKPPKDHPET